MSKSTFFKLSCHLNPVKKEEGNGESKRESKEERDGQMVRDLSGLELPV